MVVLRMVAPETTPFDVVLEATAMRFSRSASLTALEDLDPSDRTETQDDLAPKWARKTSWTGGAADGRKGGSTRSMAAVTGGAGELRGLGSFHVLGACD